MGDGLFSRDFVETFSVMHALAIPVGKTFVMYGIGFSLSRNFVRLMRGGVRGAVAVADLIRDVIIFFIVGYGIGLMGVGEKITTAFDSTTTTIFKALGVSSDVADLIMNRTLGAVYSSGVGTIGDSFLPEVLMTVPGLILGALIGGIFSLLFDK